MRGLSELKGLSPWNWDARVEDHPPGEATMRDFREQYSWVRERPKRSSTQSVKTPGSTAEKRRAKSANKEDGVGSRKKQAKDKENRGSPANTHADMSAPQAAATPTLASPAFLTPARCGEVSHPEPAVHTDGSTASKAKGCQPSTATSTHTAFAASTPKIDDAPSSGAARAAVHAEFIKQHRARTRLGNPAFSSPAVSKPSSQDAVTPAETQQTSQTSVLDKAAGTVGDMQQWHASAATARAEAPFTGNHHDQNQSGNPVFPGARPYAAQDTAEHHFESAAQPEHALSPTGPEQHTDPGAKAGTTPAANNHDQATTMASDTAVTPAVLLPNTRDVPNEQSAQPGDAAPALAMPGCGTVYAVDLQQDAPSASNTASQVPAAPQALGKQPDQVEAASLTASQQAGHAASEAASAPLLQFGRHPYYSKVSSPAEPTAVLDGGMATALQAPAQSASSTHLAPALHRVEEQSQGQAVPSTTSADAVGQTLCPADLGNAVPTRLPPDKPLASCEGNVEIATAAASAEPAAAQPRTQHNSGVSACITATPCSPHLQTTAQDSMPEHAHQATGMPHEAGAQHTDAAHHAYAQDTDMTEQSKAMPDALTADTRQRAASKDAGSLHSAVNQAALSSDTTDLDRHLHENTPQSAHHSPHGLGVHQGAPAADQQQPASSAAGQSQQTQQPGSVTKQQSLATRQHAAVSTRPQQGNQLAVLARRQQQVSGSGQHQQQQQNGVAAARQSSRWPDAKVTSMSLRSKKRKHSSWSSEQDGMSEGRAAARAPERRKGPGGYATRSRGHIGSADVPEHTDSRDERARRREVATQSSSDLAAAEALQALRYTDEEADCQEILSQGRNGYSQHTQFADLFAAPAPPVPLWVQGKTSQGPTQTRQARAVPVLPRHQQAATESALNMLASASPLSGLHKLAVTICARQKGPFCSTLDSNPPVAAQGTGPVTPLLDITVAHDNTAIAAATERSTPKTKAGLHHSTGLSLSSSLAGSATATVNAIKPAAVVSMTVPSGRDACGEALKSMVGKGSGCQVKVVQTWDQYVAAQLHAGPDKQRQAKLVALLKKELTRPDLSLLARACLMLRLEDAEAGLLYSQYPGILAACTAQKTA